MASKAHVFESLSRLLAVHENAAASIRATIALLHGERIHESSNGNGLPAVARAAVAIDEKRREYKREYDRKWRAAHRPPERPGKPGPKPGAHKTGESTARRHQNRSHSAEALAKFDTAKPRTAEELGINDPRSWVGPLVRRGYLKKKGGGYIRTAKPFHINPRDAKGLA